MVAVTMQNTTVTADNKRGIHMLIGRESEIEALQYCCDSGSSEFVVVYGRRRVGKTFLIKEFFGSNITFYATGVLNGYKNVQLDAWNEEMKRVGEPELAKAGDWFDAFKNLNILIEKTEGTNKKVVFLDEMPWMATGRSKFLLGLDYFWNRWAFSRNDVILIICGSAASWITDKIINNKAGLHNRLTQHIYVKPFSLHECELYYKNRNIPLTRYQMAEAYMIFGGIPYYLSLMKSHLSLYQNVDAMYFSENAVLRNELNNLYNSLFINSENYLIVIETLADKGIGLSRSDIIETTKIADGGSLTKILNDLVTSGFIRKYVGYGKKERDSIYQLIDFFSLFDMKFRRKREEFNENYWLGFSSTHAYSIWSGFSFEKLCLVHQNQIRKKLGISGVLTSLFSWIGKHEDKKVQIDLIIDRNDNVINLCEMKFSSGEYSVSKEYSAELRRKKSAFSYSTKTRKALVTTMVTTFGLVKNAYGMEITSQVTLDDLFENC